jgi:hypothetical protein
MKPHPMPMNLAKWIHRFGTSNRLNRTEPDWGAPLVLPEEKRKALALSLAEYQLGDGGGPCRLIAGDAEDLRASDPRVKEVIDLWFKEEAEHSRLLSGAVTRLGGAFVTDTFAFRMFNHCRRALGAQYEMLVLLLVEIVSTAYYHVICRHCDDEPVAHMCLLILRDESGHVSFHRERLSGLYPEGVSAAWELQFMALGWACAGFLWLGHRRWLKAIGATRAEFFSLVNKGLQRFMARLRLAAAPLPSTQEDEHERDWHGGYAGHSTVAIPSR